MTHDHFLCPWLIRAVAETSLIFFPLFSQHLSSVYLSLLGLLGGEHDVWFCALCFLLTSSVLVEEIFIRSNSINDPHLLSPKAYIYNIWTNFFFSPQLCWVPQTQAFRIPCLQLAWASPVLPLSIPQPPLTPAPCREPTQRSVCPTAARPLDKLRLSRLQDKRPEPRTRRPSNNSSFLSRWDPSTPSVMTAWHILNKKHFKKRLSTTWTINQIKNWHIQQICYSITQVAFLLKNIKNAIKHIIELLFKYYLKCNNTALF